MFDFFFMENLHTHVYMHKAKRARNRDGAWEGAWDGVKGREENKWERERENEVLEILIFVVALLFLFFRVGNFRVGWGGHGYMLISLAIAWKWALMIGLMTRLWNGRCGTLIAVLIDWTMIMLINWFYWLYWSLVMLCNRETSDNVVTLHFMSCLVLKIDQFTDAIWKRFRTINTFIKEHFSSTWRNLYSTPMSGIIHEPHKLSPKSSRKHFHMGRSFDISDVSSLYNPCGF